MSYDIMIGKRQWNYTFNLRRFFENYIYISCYVDGIDMEIAGLDAINNETGKVAAHTLERALIAITQDVGTNGSKWMAEQWNPENNWGCWEGAFAMLVNIYMSCLRNPNDKITVHK